MREDDNVKFSYHVPPQTTPQNITPNAMPSPATIHYSLFALHFAENFAFSAKERDVETGLSYFGARYCSSELSIWLSVDPMSDKYPSLSPYVYCANNPVKLVDPNGEEVYVGEYRYYNGQLYDKEGNAFTPNEDSFEAKALNSLNSLKGTRTGNILTSKFEGTDNNVVIKSGPRSYVGERCVNGNTGKLISQTIFWNTEGNEVETTRGIQKNRTADLGHELSHTYDQVVQRKGLNDLCPNKGSRSEWIAVNRENRIRKDLDLPYRTGYTFKNRDNTTYFVRMLDENNEPYMPKSTEWTPFEICNKKRN